MIEEPWNKHTPGDPMPCKCGESVVETETGARNRRIEPARCALWGDFLYDTHLETTAWRFVERKGEDVIQRCAECDCEGGSSECNWIASGPADPYPALEWDEDDTATVVLRKPGRPWWVRDGDLVRFSTAHDFEQASDFGRTWEWAIAFQIKRRPVLTPAEPQLLAMLSVATDDEADAIRSAARRANIEVPE